MMSGIAHRAWALLLVMGCAAPTKAVAQCRLCDAETQFSTEEAPKTPIQVEVESSLSFDRLIMMGEGEGTAILRPDGTRILSGSLGDFTGSAMVGTAVVRGEPGRAIRIELPQIIALHSLTGSQLLIDEIST